MNKKLYYIGLDIIIFILFLVLIVNIFSIFINPTIYKKNDFISSDIEEYKYYSLTREAISYYLSVSSTDYNMLNKFLHNRDENKNKKYSSQLDNTLKSINIIKVKKGLNNIYIAYFYINATSNEECRIVLQFDEKKNTYKILYDSIYESIG